MEKTSLNEGMMALILEEEALKQLSSDLAWTEALLEKYQDKVDWEAVCNNSSVLWNVSMLEKFRHKIDWKVLSGSDQKSILSPEVVSRFAAYWDWNELSGNSDLPVETIEKMADRIVWKALLNSCHYNDGFFSGEFFRKFEKYITASVLKDSNLWDAMVEEKKEELKRSICLG